jgi:hypothetical protein
LRRVASGAIFDRLDKLKRSLLANVISKAVQEFDEPLSIAFGLAKQKDHQRG